MKLKYLLPIAFFAVGVLSSGCSFEAIKKPKPVMVVNDQELTLDSFAKTLAHKMKTFDAIGAKNPQNIRVVKNSILDDFLQSSLILSWAKEKNIAVTDEERQQKIDEFRKQYPNDLAMKESLAAEGLSYEDWSAKIPNLILQKKVFDSLKENIPTPPVEELKSYYDSNKELFLQKPMIRLRQIVLEKEDEAQRLFNTLKKDTALAPLAKQFSIAPEASLGGDTGWIPKGTLDIFDKAFDWPVGKRSPVLKSSFGYHIFEVIGKKPETQLKFEDVKDSISKLMIADREQAAYSAWLEDQLKKARVFRNDDLINSVTVVTRGEK